MSLTWRELPAWQKVLTLGGGAAVAAGLVYYLVRDAEDEDEDEDGAGTMQELPPGIFFHVSDPRGVTVGLRTRPDTSDDSRCGDKAVLRPGERFEVSVIVDGDDGQKFLKLADGRGWAFTKSTRDGRTLCEPTPREGKASPEAQLEEIKGLFPPGEYRLIAEGHPTVEASTESPDTGDQLPTGTIVQVLETEVLLEEKRVRGRIEKPAGWLSLLKLDDGYRWVMPAKLPSMADMPAGSRERMMFEQMKKMFTERKELLDQVVEQAKSDTTFPEFGERLAAGEEPEAVAAEFQIMMMMGGMGGMGGRGGP